MSTIVVKNATIFTGKDVIEGGDLAADGGRILEIGGGVAAPAGAEVIDAGGRLVTPGFTIGHTHVYSALARGISLKGEPARNFIEILDKLWWLLDRKLTLEQVDLSAKLYGAACLKSGVTTIFDHHASFGAIRGSLDVLARALGQVGLRSCLCFEVSDRGGELRTRDAIDENIDFLERVKEEGGAMLRGMFGLHASFTLTRETLRRCAASADPDRVGFHVHAAEDREDQGITLREHGRRVVERLGDAGILGCRTICSHGIWLDQREIDLLAETGTTVAYNPQSNMNNAVGALRLKTMIGAGVKVVLGTDGFAANIFREALAGQILQNHIEGEPGAGWRYFPAMVLEGNNRLMEECFGTSNAAMEKGAACDVVLWNYDPPTPVTKDNFWGHAIFGLLDTTADFVVAGGKVVLKGGRCTGIDETGVNRECRLAARSLWKSMETP
jgi:putative selenium metabolism protein SsnA